MGLEHDPKNMTGLMNLALSLEKSNRYKEAAETWQKYIDLEPKENDLQVALSHLGACQLK
jgi:cytochrome c-type biogenesis protein CcmH/NrfG